MAYRNKVIHNPASGQQYTFLQTASDTGGALLEMECLFAPFTQEPVLHHHPVQEETFTILSGVLTLRMRQRVKEYHAGESFVVPPGEVHAMWNAGEAPVLVNWKVSPALESEYFFETLAGLATAGKTDTHGKPALLQYALLALRFAPVFRLANPPWIIQVLVFNTLAPLARLAGYRPRYAEFED